MEFVRGWFEIGSVYGVSGKEVKAWYADDAPILLLGNRPVAELGRLWNWLLTTYGGKNREPLGMSAAEAKKLFPDGGEKALVAAVLAKRKDALRDSAP